MQPQINTVLNELENSIRVKEPSFRLFLETGFGCSRINRKNQSGISLITKAMITGLYR